MTGELVQEILLKRGIPKDKHEEFLDPDYDKQSHDPFLLPDMDKAVKRIIKARDEDERIVVYGDYDVDGMTATAILYDALTRFGMKIETYTPDRFTEGYGLNMNAMRSLAKTDASLVITVDCGSLSHDEIDVAQKLGLDVIITDHHAVAEIMPPAIATINPHRSDSKYPFADLAGCGVAFKLVQALQSRIDGLSKGQEKWLLDLVALGTVCDIVPLLDENRMVVYWGLEVLKRTKRPGLKALMAVTDVVPSKMDAQKIGFVLGPRLNAAGRINTAKLALELLVTSDNNRALELAQKLDSLNSERRTEQGRIFGEAIERIENSNLAEDSVCVVANEGWNEGVIGIVASKLMERYHKPTFVLSINEKKVKGSGRSFGDFNLAKAIDATRDNIEKGGGHAAAGGVTLLSDSIDRWRNDLNKYYDNLNLKGQEMFLLAEEDIIETDFVEINLDLINVLKKLEPFGMCNEQPIFKFEKMKVVYADRIGKEKNHLKITLSDGKKKLKFIAFSPPEGWFVDSEDCINIWVNLDVNEWQGQQSIEGKILRLERVDTL